MSIEIKVLASILFIITSTFVSAGPLEPTAPPGSTMKSLNEVPPTWSQKLADGQRFELVLSEDAVLDKETGLVWERTPRATPSAWNTAVESCYKGGTGGRAGWRLPSVPEMASLFYWGAGLPLGSNHPFNVPDLNECFGLFCQFWSSTTTLYDDNEAYSVRIEVSSDNWDAAYPEIKSSTHRVWCVRGGSGPIGQ
ncbi:MAG: DUF1566 domain-containing protein [Gammaproteobacteria bacterium]|nr:DUF1566 domain-containing protein [Gammaproteobacteria bacterium]